MSVATKLMIQIAAKLGGEPWKLNTPDAVSFHYSPQLSKLSQLV